MAIGAVSLSKGRKSILGQAACSSPFPRTRILPASTWPGPTPSSMPSVPTSKETFSGPLTSPRGRHPSRSFSRLRMSSRSWLPPEWEQRQPSLLIREQHFLKHEHSVKGGHHMSTEETMNHRRYRDVRSQPSDR